MNGSDAVSEYSFGYEEPDETSELGEIPEAQGPKALRDHLKQISSQLKDLKADNDRLKAAQTRSELEDTLKAKGYAPQAAGLFTGTPDKLDDWLTANGGALAKLPAAPGEEGSGEQAPAGPPASTVPASGQEQMQRMTEQGTQGVAPPQGSDKELAAALAACSTEEEFNKLMQSHGSPYDWS